MYPSLFELPLWLSEIPEWVPLFGGTRFGGRPFFSYGILLGTSAFIAWIFAHQMVERLGGDRRKLRVLLVSTLIGAIVGARGLYFAASDPDSFSFAGLFSLSSGGLVAYGGFLGGMAAGLAAAAFMRTSWLLYADAVAPALALGTGLTRIGCYLFGCDFGQPTDLPFGVQFTHWDLPSLSGWISDGSPAWLQHFPTSDFPLPTSHFGDLFPPPLTPFLWPTQLLLSLKGFLGFALLMWYLPRRTFNGGLILMFLAWYAVARFFIEFLRGDAIRGTGVFGTPFSTSQIVAAGVLLVVIPLWLWLARKKPAKTS